MISAQCEIRFFGEMHSCRAAALNHDRHHKTTSATDSVRESKNRVVAFD